MGPAGRRDGGFGRALSAQGAKETAASATFSMAQLATVGSMLLIGTLATLVLGVAIGVFVTRQISTELRTVIHELDESATQVSGAAAQIAQSSQSLAHDASEQAASLQETSASSEEINAMAAQNAENTQ